MIFDYLKNINIYENIHRDLKKGFKFALALADKPVGKYEGENFFAVVQEGDTKYYKECNFEVHKKYIDVQIMVVGEEIMEWNNIESLKLSADYNDENDAAFYEGDGNLFNIKKNMFYIAYPQDAHKPCVHTKLQKKYKKIILKLKI
ncbi:MAG: YhcH/YjgK/YiaL family protein [Lachnospirales bacterium]